MKSKIVSNVPLPPNKDGYGFNKLEVGQCLIVETDKPANAVAAAHNWVYRTKGRKVVTRVIDGKVHIWRTE